MVGVLLNFLALAALAIAVMCGLYGWRLIRTEARRLRRRVQPHYLMTTHRKRLWTNNNN